MIPICYTGNKGIFKGILLSALSVAKVTKNPLELLVLTMDLSSVNKKFQPITDEQISVLEAVLREFNPESAVRKYDVTELYSAEMKGGKNEASSYTPYAMIRLFLDVLPDIPEKLIYLDADTLCLKDISELYDTDVEDCEYGAALDYMGHFFINKDYCNSGILLLNMAKIRKTELFKKARRLVVRKRMKMPDQSALHKLAECRCYLPRKFNEQREIQSDTVIKHFCKGIKFYPLFFYIYNYKPWNREQVHEKLHINAFDDLYDIYDRMAEKYPLIGQE